MIAAVNGYSVNGGLEFSREVRTNQEREAAIKDAWATKYVIEVVAAVCGQQVRWASVIRNLQDLADHVGAGNADVESIARRVYKDTSCGCSASVVFTPGGDYFWVAGFCEGADVEHTVYRVFLPCTPEAITEAIERADQDGCATWDEREGEE